MLLPILLALSASTPAPPPDSAARTECFVLEEPTEEGMEPVAVIALRRVAGEHGLLFEEEFVFRENGLRVLVEELHDQPGEALSPRLIWRELRVSPATGRTWLAEWDAERGLVSTASYGSASPVHGSLAGPRPRFPLALIESLRRGEAPSTVTTLDPLSRRRVQLSIQSKTRAGRREYSLLREDGSLAGRYLFEGNALVELALQGGGRVARASSSTEFDRLAEQWRVVYDPLEALRAFARNPHALPR